MLCSSIKNFSIRLPIARVFICIGVAVMDQPVYLRLSCAVQHYVWGKVGSESEVALLKKGGDHVDNSQFAVSEDKHYAEVYI